jgi:pimeloyl-ACP methyl ester carboxylesterase
MQKILFVHGMFLNAKSWEPWKAFFAARGYECVAPSWPLHEGEPAALRAVVPPGLGKLTLEQVLDAMQAEASKLDKPIVIGHSVGGLLTQLLVARGLASVGVAISSVAPNRMLAADLGFIRNSAQIANPIKGDDFVPMDADGWYENFANTMERSASDAAFETYAVNDSRNVFRGCLTDVAKIDVDRPHVPLLFVGAEKDEIIPSPLCKRNAEAYTDKSSRSDFIEFSNRGHYITGEPNWQEVATYIANWLEQAAPIAVTRAQDLKPD